MDDRGWTKTKVGRIVYTGKLKLFSFKSLRRILLNMVRQDQISWAERLELAKILFPAKIIPTDQPDSLERYTIFEQIREFLVEKLIPLPGLAKDLIVWLVDLEGEALKKFLEDWVRKF